MRLIKNERSDFSNNYEKKVDNDFDAFYYSVVVFVYGWCSVC